VRTGNGEGSEVSQTYRREMFRCWGRVKILWQIINPFLVTIFV